MLAPRDLAFVGLWERWREMSRREQYASSVANAQSDYKRSFIMACVLSRI
jgi:hypothetical protein